MRVCHRDLCRAQQLGHARRGDSSGDRAADLRYRKRPSHPLSPALEDLT